MTTTRVYYSVYFEVIMLVESEKWFNDLSSAGAWWEYIGELE